MTRTSGNVTFSDPSSTFAEARVGNIVLGALALVVLLVAGLFCMAACYQRSR